MDFTKLDPNNLTAYGLLVILILGAGHFIVTKVWPFYRDVYMPAKLKAEETRIQREYEVQRDMLNVLSSVRDLLSACNAKLDELLDRPFKQDEKPSVKRKTNTSLPTPKQG